MFEDFGFECFQYLGDVVRSFCNTAFEANLIIDFEPDGCTNLL